MTIKRIKHLADFFYSSNSAVDVPLRISCVTGQFTGFDLDRESFISLFKILAKSQNLKDDLAAFVESQYGQHE
jgi:hypothetical protein